MASYAMAHLKMDMLLTETGYRPPTPEGGAEPQRLKIFLTNSLEEAHPDTQTLFSSWLSDEADQANAIKRDAPVMVVIGNPPYSGESANKGEWIMNLMEDYKKEPGGKEKLKERNPKWINDDYVKFMRFGQHFIDKNGRTGETSFYEKTDVCMYPLDDAEIRRYIAGGEPMDKAGSYGIQGQAAAFVKEIHGDYNNVVGLPVGRLYQELKKLGVMEWN